MKPSDRKNRLSGILFTMLIMAFVVGHTNPASAQVADFIGAPTEVYVGQSVTFTDISSGLPFAYTTNWAFEMGTPDTKSGVAANASFPIVYNTASATPYDVTMYVIYAAGRPGPIVTKTQYILVKELDRDWGDAPDNIPGGIMYRTISASNGASHLYSRELYLGSLVDLEADGQPTATALGDDVLDNDDEDGVTSGGGLFNKLIAGNVTAIEVEVNGNGYLNAWVDFDINGDWDGAGEQVLVSTPVTDGTNNFNITVPPTATLGDTYVRFRLCSDPAITWYYGDAPDGEVEDYLVEIREEQLDFGDAPDGGGANYYTLLPQGARHFISDNIYLGYLRNPPDAEADGQPNTSAVGDDGNGIDDEDGVAGPIVLTSGTFNTVTVHTVGQGILRMWVDLNNNDQWDDPGGERLLQIGLGTGTHNLSVWVPGNAVAGKTFARFRYSNDQDLSYHGAGDDGEVEDYLIVIQSQDDLDFGDAPNSYKTILPNGARHPISDAIYLGLVGPPDAEADGIPSVGAVGDDLNNDDDENGVEFMDPIIPGQNTSIKITTQGQGHLAVWIDWNDNGDFGDPGEHIINAFRPGPTNISNQTILVPPNAVVGKTYLRARFSAAATVNGVSVAVGNGNDYQSMNALGSDSDGGSKNPLYGPMITYYGLGPPGEVEDYEVTIEEDTGLDFGDAGDPTFPTMLASDGARHPISRDIFLGPCGPPDSEPDGQAPAGGGDDLNGYDDEDGITSIPKLTPGVTVPMKVRTYLALNLTGYFHGWIDFNNDGDWDDAGEHVFSGLPLGDGPHVLNVPVPVDASTGLLTARFRYSVDPVLGYDKLGGLGEVEDYRLPLRLDFGDAMQSYPVLLADNGARHPRTAAIYLGSKPDIELDGNPSMLANGDDLDIGDDEDGVMIPILVPGFNATLQITTFCSPSITGYLHGWIDFDGDNDWSGANEYVFNGIPLTTGVHNLVVYVPPTAIPGETYARFRYSIDSSLGYDGGGSPGEVEDYLVRISKVEYDFGDAPDDEGAPLYPTLFVNNGAYHKIIQGVHLGSKIDDELDGQPDGNAMGDDEADDDDEDGVVFNTAITPGQMANITVTASVDGFLSAWADFNGNGIWENNAERIFYKESITTNNSLNFPVPIWAQTDNIYFRFRFCTVSIISPESANAAEGAAADGLSKVTVPDPHYFPTGFAPDGEVEDYLVSVTPTELGAIKWIQPPLKNPESYYPNSYWGWDEPSVYSEKVIVDDWFCGDPHPVTGLQFWGSYCEWDSVFPPPDAPESFHIAIWSDDTDGPDDRKPGKVLWQKTVSRSQLGEAVDTSDFHPLHMTERDTCFRYQYSIPQADWFYQEGDSTYYWLSISAMYSGQTPDDYVWGWKTRDRYFRADAIRITSPASPVLNSNYNSGEIVSEEYDMTFILHTTEQERYFDYGDALDPGYPTLFRSNGAHHYIWPGIFMGDTVDVEPDGLPDVNANLDDTNIYDDEDGVTFVNALVGEDVGRIVVNASVPGILNAWIDYTDDGDWDDTGEHIFIDMPLFIGNNNLVFNVPGFSVGVTTIARFRYSMVPGIRPEELTIGGEVEDYEVSISPTTGVHDRGDGNLPGEFRMFQNYPNPFNPQTTIKFQLPVDGEVILTVYDIYGREVRTLIHGEWSAGSYEIVWDGRDRNGQVVATGVYFCRVDVRTSAGTSRNYVDVKKMIFMK